MTRRQARSPRPYRFGAAIGRYCPIQLGHERVLQSLKELCDTAIVFVGSANADWSLPLFFNYSERTRFVRAIFPDIRLVPLPDFPNDNAAWLQAIDDMLGAAGMDPRETTFFGGSDEDLLVLSDGGRRQTHIVNRYDGSTPVISASQVRDALIYGRSLDGMLNPLITPLVQDLWTHKWPDFLKKR